jgi:CRISPR-associated protein Csb1
MNGKELHERIVAACTGGFAAARAVTKLEPIGGFGDAIFPPTYLGPGNNASYAWEKRYRADTGEVEDAVIVDSVQSQANRFEMVLRDAVRSGDLQIPLIQTTIPGYGELTSLEVPHRVNDAIFRDCDLDGVRFGDSETGRRLRAAREWDARALFEHAPTVLLFGTWDSQSGGGTNTAKVARSLVSEIVGLGAVKTARTASRIDPLGIKTFEIHRNLDTGDWGLEASGLGKGKIKKTKPSEINHGNVAPTINSDTGGVSIRQAVQTTVLSFTQLRKIRFGAGNEGDVAGRTVLAALALYAVQLQWRDGFQLRSRCQLVPVGDGGPAFELIGASSGARAPLDAGLDATREAFEASLEAAKRTGLQWNTTPVVLTPSKRLIDLVEKSNKLVSDTVSEG